MKKTIAILLALCMITALCACGKTAPAPAEAPAAPVEAPAAPAEEPAAVEEPKLDYPTQPITMMVAWTAGGGSDLLTRAIAADFPEFVGANANVMNREGAGGTVGFAEAVDYANDGYNLLYSTSGIFSAQPLLRDVEFSIDDFDFICGVGEKPLALVVPAEWGVSNLQEWIDYLNANNIEAVIGTSGSAGSIPAFGIEALVANLQEMGFSAYNIANYTGAGEVIPALLSGEINCGFFHPHEAKPYVESNDFSVIAVATDERSANFPDLPTFKEQGVDFTLAVLEGYIAPAGIDPAIRDYLENAILTILEEGSNYKTYAEGSGHQVKPTSGEAFKQAVVDQTALFKEMFG